MKKSGTLLIVDDEKHTRDGLRRALENRFEIYLAADLESAQEVLSSEPIDLVLTDLRLNSSSTEGGLEVLKACQALHKPPICIVMTAYGSVDSAVEAMRRGAYDYVTKPVHIDELELLLLRALKAEKIEKENIQLKEQLNFKYGLEQIIGESAKMVDIFQLIRQVADSRATVLIEGESGTGKELVARAIHSLSPRKNKSFIPIHCAALSPTVLESELFGHEKGAFTGAHERRIGRFEQADKGTLFMDEIGEIDPSTQVKLLRVLGERKFERVGGNTSIEVDVRLIAATHRKLEEMVKNGTFREDLFYRLDVVRIHLPPLRERKEDLPLLTRAFLEQACKENQKPLLSLSPPAEQAILRYDWPGNVRELKSAIEHGVVLCRSHQIELRDLPLKIAHAADAAHFIDPTQNIQKGDSSLNLQEMEKIMILKALEKSKHNKTEAANLLGISRRTLHRKLQEYKID